MKTFILGGMRSGKSRMAERLACASGKQVIYIATALAGDSEMQDRIDRHRHDRPTGWHVIEEPYELAAAMKAHAAPEHCVLVDCLTLWITQLLCTYPSRLAHEREAFLKNYAASPGDLIVVSNETGLGIVPMDRMSRDFCDIAGRLHQDIAQVSERVIFMAAGLPLPMKGVLP